MHCHWSKNYFVNSIFELNNYVLLGFPRWEWSWWTNARHITVKVIDGHCKNGHQYSKNQGLREVGIVGLCPFDTGIRSAWQFGSHVFQQRLNHLVTWKYSEKITIKHENSLIKNLKKITNEGKSLFFRNNFFPSKNEKKREKCGKNSKSQVKAWRISAKMKNHLYLKIVVIKLRTWKTAIFPSKTESFYRH